jgi:cysteine desulfurase
LEPAASPSAKFTEPPKLLETMVRRESYLDWNATAPLRPEAAAAVTAALRDYGNASSVHRWGRAARQRVENAREAVAVLIGADPEGVIFVSGGTEANQLALLGSGRERVLISAVEHSSVLQAVQHAERIPVSADGIVELGQLEELLASDPHSALVSVMLANNETGAIQPVAEVAAIAHRYGALFHCDAVQAAGKIPVDVATIGADLISLSAHKLGGPPGIGALIICGTIEVAPMIRGGGQERGRRAGSENLPGIAGFAAAADAATHRLADYERVQGLRNGIESAVLATAPEAIVIGGAAPRLPNTSAIALPGISAETQVIALDLDGVMVSAGAACSSGKVGPSHVLQAMGAAPEIAGSTIRVSLGWSTTEAEIEHFLEAWTAMYRRAKPHAAAARAA